jgi:hypothetical protein
MAILINSFSSPSNLITKYLVPNNFIRTKVNISMLWITSVSLMLRLFWKNRHDMAAWKPGPKVVNPNIITHLKLTDFSTISAHISERVFSWQRTDWYLWIFVTMKLHSQLILHSAEWSNCKYECCYENHPVKGKYISNWYSVIKQCESSNKGI